MANICAVTGKRRTVGNNVSHAKNRTKRTFKPNTHAKRFRLSNGRMVKLNVSAKGLRIIDKLGIDAVIARIKSQEN